MGIDIMVFAERRVDDCYEHMPHLKVFGWRYRGMFEFLGNGHNKSGVPSLSDLRGVPANSFLYPEFAPGGRAEGGSDQSWLSVRELLDFDYETTFVGKFRIQSDGDCISFADWGDPTAATEITVRRFLGPDFFVDLDRLAQSGADRIVFLFY